MENQQDEPSSVPDSVNKQSDHVSDVEGRVVPEAGEEEQKRDTWAQHFLFILTCVGFAVGLGNVWRFPYLCYANGGGAFLIPYFCCLFMLGIPVFFLEIYIGQFVGAGTVTIMEINPLFKGLGWSMVIVAGYTAVFYSILVATAIYFMIASLIPDLPWASCDHDWNSCHCRPITMDKSEINSAMWINQTKDECKGVLTSSDQRSSPSHEFYYDKLLEVTDHLTEIGGLKWDLTLCNLFVWTIVFCIIRRGVRSIGKVVYFSSLMPYLLLAVLLLKTYSLEGAEKGIQYYMDFNFEKITYSAVWRQAASQILFSLSCCMGSLMVLSSYNKFHANCIRDSIAVPLINCATSFYAGFTIFTTLGFMAHITGVDISEVATSGPGLIFVVYPIALSQLPYANVWSIFFFLMVTLLGVGSLFPLCETVVTSVQDEFPAFRKPQANLRLRLFVCVMAFVLGLPETTRGGLYIFTIANSFLDFPLLIVGLAEILALVPIYGFSRFNNDVRLMLGHNVLSMRIFTYYFRWALISISPALLVWIFIHQIMAYTPITSQDGFPYWAEYIGWLLVTAIMIWAPLWFIGYYCWTGGYKHLKEISKPSERFGPNLPEGYGDKESAENQDERDRDEQNQEKNEQDQDDEQQPKTNPLGLNIRTMDEMQDQMSVVESVV